MNALNERSGRLVRVFAALVLCFLATGCATQKIDWAARVGIYTYDQAVLELGPPDKQAKLDDGTIVADWMTQQGYTRAYPGYPYGTYPYWYRPYYYSYPYYLQYPSYFIRLMFGADGKLKAWKKYSL
jgi:hypothetical protein